jgi:alkaline phosphatase
MKRRDLLKGGLWAGAAGMSGGLLGCAPGMGAPGALAQGPGVDGTRPWSRRARNVIFLVYDGTGYEDAAAAGHFSRRILNRPLLFERLLSEGAAGSMQTHSLTSVVTDSSAASTTWSTGRKVVNYDVSMFPDGRPLTTIFDLARGRGMATGLVTTTRITHATPAAWATKVRNRDLEQEIAAQYLEAAPDVLLGGARGPFEDREDGRDLFAEFRQRGYDVLHTPEDLARTNGSRLLGTFTPGMEHMPYEVDRRFQGRPVPSLAQMTTRALEVLSGSERGFVLQVEAGRIDLANHYNDPGGMIWDWMAADEALAVVKDFVDRDGETLLITAADHDTGGSVVYGFGIWFLRSTEAFETLGKRKASNEWLLEHGLPARPSAEDVREAVTRHLGFSPTAEQAAEVATVLGAPRPVPAELRRGHWNAHYLHPENTVGQILSTSPSRAPDRPNIAYGTSSHTAGLVPAVLYGPMVPQGSLGVIDNTALYHVMTEALGIDFQNPAMTEEEARAILAQRADAAAPEPATVHG